MPIKETFSSFPVFDIESQLSDSDTSSANDSVLSAKYATKEDQDVAVFMAIAERLSIKSLLHLLQGHAQSQMMQFDEEKKKPVKPPKKMVKKRFRWAKAKDRVNVKEVVYKIESVKNYPLWWTDDEMGEMRQQAIDAVKYFRKKKKKYTEAIEAIATAPAYEDTPSNRALVEKAMKQLTKDSYARGLESHIVALLGEFRAETVNAVLSEQERCYYDRNTYDETAEYLRERSVEFSHLSHCFSQKMGECDHIEALKAMLAKWVK